MNKHIFPLFGWPAMVAFPSLCFRNYEVLEKGFHSPKCVEMLNTTSNT